MRCWEPLERFFFALFDLFTFSILILIILMGFTYDFQLSAPGTPSRSRAPSRPASRPTSPTRAGASKRKAPGPLLLTKRSSTDPLRAFPTEVSQRIFGLLSLSDLAKTSRVCKKWARSQSLNYGESSSVILGCGSCKGLNDSIPFSLVPALS